MLQNVEKFEINKTADNVTCWKYIQKPLQ